MDRKGARVKIVIIDASRTNPLESNVSACRKQDLPRSLRPTSRSQSPPPPRARWAMMPGAAKDDDATGAADGVCRRVDQTDPDTGFERRRCSSVAPASAYPARPNGGAGPMGRIDPCRNGSYSRGRRRSVRRLVSYAGRRLSAAAPRHRRRHKPPGSAPANATTATCAAGSARSPADHFPGDCPECSELIIVPAGFVRDGFDGSNSQAPFTR